MLPDAYGAFWERDVHKYCVTREPRIVDTCDNHTLWECDFLKAFTIGERGIADSLHTVRNRDFRKTLAAAERPITDLLDAVRNGDAGQAGALGERQGANARDDLFVVDRRDFDVGVGAGSDSGNRTGSVSVGNELQPFRAFVQGGRGGQGASEDNGGFHGRVPFSGLSL